jgi:predicted dehydrogenase
LARFAAGRLPTALFADVVVADGIAQRMTAMMWFPDEVTATLSCGYDTATRKWFEIAGSGASLICDDYTRPWADRPARCWIHDASGNVESQTFEGNQERRMIAHLVSGEPLERWQRQALDTQRILDALGRSAAGEGKVTLDR